MPWVQKGSVTNMKKILSLILIVAALTGLLIPAQAAGGNVNLTKKQQLLIDALGVSAETVENPDEITRADFSRMLVAAAFEQAEQYSNATLDFADVSDGHEAYSQIKLLKGMGVVNGDGYNRFNPDNKITVQQAVAMVKRLVANGLPLSMEIEKTIETQLLDRVIGINTLSYESAQMLICNMMELELFTGYLDNSDAKTYVESQRKLYYVKGVVTDDGDVCLTGQSDISDNTIKIDDVEFVNETKNTNLFAYAVEGWYKAEKDENILLSVDKSNKNTELFIESKNIEEFDSETRTYMYYENENDSKTKKAKIPTDIIPVYNGVTVTIGESSFTKDNYSPKYGTVRLLDNNNDGDYDYIFIDDYKTAVVSKVSEEDKNIFFKNVLDSITLEEKTYEIEDSDGEKYALTDLKENDILLIRTSFDGEIIKMIVSSTITQDVCNGIKRDENKIITQTGGVYEFSPYFEDVFGIELLESGKMYTFYFDAFGKIAQIVNADESTWNVGYLFKAYNAEDEDYLVKISDLSGVKKIMHLSERVKIYLPDNTIARYKNDEAVNVLNEKAIKTFSDGSSSIIRYRQNMSGEITEIELPLDKRFEVSDLKEERLYVLNDASTAALHYNSSIFGGNFAINAQTSMLMIDTNEEEAAKVESALFEADTSYNVIAYATDKDTNTAKYMTISSNTFDNNDVYKTKFYFAVNKIYSTYDEENEEVVIMLEGMKNSTEATLKITDTSVINNVVDLAGTPSTIESGDVLRCWEGKKENEIQKIILVYDYNGTGIDGTGNYGEIGWLAGTKVSYYTNSKDNLGIPSAFNVHSGGFDTANDSNKYYNANMRVFLGFAYTKNSNFVSVTNQKLNSGGKYIHNYDTNMYVTEMFAASAGGFVKISRGSQNNITLQKVTVNDIKAYREYGSEASKLLVLYSKYRPDMVYIIE